MQEWPSNLSNLIEYWTDISAAIIYIGCIRKKFCCINVKNVLPLLVFWIVYIVTTALSDQSQLFGVGHKAFVMVAIVLLVSREMKKDPDAIITVLMVIYTGYTLLNNILVLIFPNGIYTVQTSETHLGHLLGTDNAIVYVAIPGLIILCVYTLWKNNKIDNFTKFFIALLIVTLVRLWAVSGALSIIFFVAVLLLARKKGIIKPNICFIGMAVVITVLFTTGTVLPLVSSFIENILKKSATFSNRIYWWSYGINMIRQKPIFGWGGYFSKGGSSLGRRIYPVHTTYLQILIDGGFALFMPFVWAFVRASRVIEKYMNGKYGRVFLAGLMAMMLSYTFEWSQYYHLMIIFSLLFNLEYLVEWNTNIRKHRSTHGLSRKIT